MIWQAQKKRCYNPNFKQFKDYGGRGIIMSDEFKNDFSVWLNYLMSLENAFIDGYSIDRVDNNGNYERGNLKWSTRSEQSINRRVFANNTSMFTGVSFKDSKQIN